MKFGLTREMMIPKNATKVCDKASDAVAYIYANASGKPCAQVYYGKQAKPVARNYFSSEAQREKTIRELFEARQRHHARVIENRATPSGTATRNRAIKTLLEGKYGKGKVSVTGNRGTAYGWIDVRIDAPKPDCAYGDTQHLIVQMCEAAGLRIGRYDSGDYGSGYEMHVRFTG